MIDNKLNNRIGNKKYDINKIINEMNSIPNFDKQIYLQGISKDMDPISPTLNNKYLEVDECEKQYNITLFDIPYINSIIEEHKLCRTRLMKILPKRCYYWHKDNTKRLHIPLITNPHCFMVYEDGIVHLPADGNYYIEDTCKYHSFMNASDYPRIHLVGSLYS